MRKWILFSLSLFFWIHASIRAQDVVGCTQLLEDAREAYDAGMVELVPELLLSCIESGLTGEPKMDAYKLVINAYLFDYLPDEADSLMSDFLDDYPEYQPMPSDPDEFVLLLQAVRKRRADEAAALAEEERLRREAAMEEKLREEEEQKSQGRQKRTTSGTQSPRMGFALGINGSIPRVGEPFSTGDPLQDNGDFSMNAGYLLGGTAYFPLGRSTELGIELFYNRTRFDYSASPQAFTTYTTREFQGRLQLPVSLAVYLNPASQTRVYLRFGMIPDYMLSSSVSATRSYTETGSSYLRDVELEDLVIKETRTRLNLSGMVGLGVRIPFGNSFFFTEARYCAGLFLANREESRYDSQDLIWLIYHVDSDFRINQLQLNVGISWNLN